VKPEAVQTTFQSAKKSGIESSQTGRDEEEGITTFGLDGRREKMVAVDQQKSAGVPLLGESPEEAGQELRSALVGGNVPGLMEKVRAEGDPRSWPQRDDTIGVPTDRDQPQVQVQAAFGGSLLERTRWLTDDPHCVFLVSRPWPEWLLAHTPQA
jgi:hypothetical protein